MQARRRERATAAEPAISDTRTNVRRLIIGAAILLILLGGAFTLGLLGWWIVILVVALGLLAGALQSRFRGPPPP